MPMQTTATARIEVFRPGSFTSMEGRSLTYSVADLRAIADAYDPETAPAPVVVGHPTTDAPAYAWAKGFEYDASAGKLFATIGEIDPAFSEAVKAGRYKKVSLSFFQPETPSNPVPGTWYPRHIGFLGGAAPAVSGLKNVQFSAPDATVTVSAELGADEGVSVLRSVRDFLNEKIGHGAAGKETASFGVEWLSETTMDKQQTQQPHNPKTIASFAERDELVKLRREIAEGKVDKLIDAGKVLPTFKDEILSFAASLDETATVSFADGKKMPSRDWFMSFLERQPKQVSFGAFDLGSAPDDVAPPPLAVPDGYKVDTGNNELYQRARRIEREKGVSFSEAVDIARGK